MLLAGERDGETGCSPAWAALPVGAAGWHWVMQPPPVLRLLSRQGEPRGAETRAAPAKPARVRSPGVLLPRRREKTWN